MGILEKLHSHVKRGRSQPAKMAQITLPYDRGVERTGDTYFYPMGLGTASGVRGATVWACIQRVAQRVAQARFRVIDRDGAEVDHVLNNLLLSPSGREGRYTFQSFVAECLLTDGNAYLLKRGDTRGTPYPTSLAIADPRSASISASTNGGAGYIYSLGMPTPGLGVQNTVQVSNLSVVHVKGPFYDPALGKSASPLVAAGGSIELYLESLKSSVAYLKNAVRFGGFLKTQYPLEELVENDSAIVENLEHTFGGTQNAGQLALLGHGIEFQPPISLAKEMLLDDQLNWAAGEICRVFGVPQAMVMMSKGQRPNIEEMTDSLMRDAVAPACAQIGSAYTERLLLPRDRQNGLRIEADLSRFANPTATGQAEQLMKLAQTGIFTINELRKIKGHPARADGDVFPQVAGAPDSKDAVESGNDDE